MDSEFYLQARREWDERHGDLVLGKRNWQITSAGLMLLNLILALYQNQRARISQSDRKADGESSS